MIFMPKIFLETYNEFVDIRPLTVAEYSDLEWTCEGHGINMRDVLGFEQSFLKRFFVAKEACRRGIIDHDIASLVDDFIGLKDIVDIGTEILELTVVR